MLIKYHAQVARHVKLMDKNLCACLVRNENIVTTTAKAKRAQPKIERFLSKSLYQLRTYPDRPAEALNYLQPPDKKDVVPKIKGELAERYAGRSVGFTRIIRLEPRLGDDKASMLAIELVDSAYEIKFWFMAKTIARLELQKIPADSITSANVRKLTASSPERVAEFKKAVETCKQKFFDYDPETKTVTTERARKNLQNLPADIEFHGGKRFDEFARSKKYVTKPRLAKSQASSIPPSPFLQATA